MNYRSKKTRIQKEKRSKREEIIPKEEKQEIINNHRLLKNLTENKKKKTWHEQMTADKGLKENNKISRVCVILLDESSIYIFH